MIESLIINSVVCLEAMLIVFAVMRIRKLYLESQKEESQTENSRRKVQNSSNVTPLSELKTTLTEAHKQAA